ncbi:hypothetical protein ACE41F_26705 [Bacillus cereus]|uniref:hypothetical protein n=1 Tax=Bacillus cereus TaxID=1396 RepID=UPI0035CB172C
MKLVKNETKREVVTGTVTLKVTAQELAAITAAVGLPSQKELEKAINVKPTHMTDATGTFRLYENLLSTYRTVFGGAK